MNIAKTNHQFRTYDSDGDFNLLSVDEAIARGHNREWKTWTCSAGKNGLYVDYDGNVWVCNTASANVMRMNLDRKKFIDIQIKNGATNIDRSNLYTWKPKPENLIGKVFGYLGNMQTFEAPKEWIPSCPFNACSCGADVILPKAETPDYKWLVTDVDYADQRQKADKVFPIRAVEANFPIPKQVLWDLGRNCNYDCSYCWPSVHNRTDEHKSFDSMVAFAYSLINRWAAKNEPIRWLFGGGEPTLNPSFLAFCKYLHYSDQLILVTTNGSRDHKYWKELMNYINNVNLSAHFESFIESRFLKNIETIGAHILQSKEDKWLEIKLMAPPEAFDKSIALRDKINAMGILDSVSARGRNVGCISLVPIRSLVDAGTVVNYTEDQLLAFQNQ